MTQRNQVPNSQPTPLAGFEPATSDFVVVALYPLSYRGMQGASYFVDYM